MSDLYKITDHKGMGKKLKFLLPRNTFDVLRKIYNTTMTSMPYGLKYGIATNLRRSKYPYCIIEDGDVVIQVGAPKDILFAGRSRAMHFLRLVGTGKVLVVEPEADNCAAIKSLCESNGIVDKLCLEEKGAWSEQGKLRFLYNPEHPASNILSTVDEQKPEELELQKFNEVEIEVDTLDGLIEKNQLPTPKLISITANGAELAILEGLKDTLKRGVPYISLAATGEGYVEKMTEYGYSLKAFDDRGYTFHRQTQA